MMIAFVFAAGTNAFAYWNSDKMVLSMQGAKEIDRPHGARALSDDKAVGRQCRAAHAKALSDRNRPAQCVCHRAQPGKRAWLRCRSGLVRHLETAGSGGGHRARAGPYQEPRHPDHDDHRNACRCDLDAGPVRAVFRRHAVQQQSAWLCRRHRHGDFGAHRRHAGADGGEPDARIRGRQGWRG